MQTEEYARLYHMEDRYWWFVARRRLALRLLDRVAPRGAKALDLGCGAGAVLKALRERGPTIGLDLSDVALSYCRHRGLDDLVRADARHLPFHDGSFDVVVTLDTVEHIPDDLGALREAARVLKPGGLLVMNVPAFRWLWGPHDVALMHRRRYTRPQVRKLLEEAGFRPERLTYSVFLLFPALVAVRVVEKLKRGPAEASLPPVPAWMNRALVQLMDFEANLIERWALPWGSSVVAVARKV